MGWLDAHSPVGISLTRTHRRLVELPADLTRDPYGARR
jgi:hypothetical protein